MELFQPQVFELRTYQLMVSVCWENVHFSRKVFRTVAIFLLEFFEEWTCSLIQGPNIALSYILFNVQANFLLAGRVVASYEHLLGIDCLFQ